MIIRHFVGNNNLDTCKIKRSSGGQLQWSSSFDSCQCRPVWPDWAFFAILATLKSHFLPKSADLFIILEKGSNLSSENCLCNDLRNSREFVNYGFKFNWIPNTYSLSALPQYICFSKKPNERTNKRMHATHANIHWCVFNI